MEIFKEAEQAGHVVHPQRNLSFWMRCKLRPGGGHGVFHLTFKDRMTFDFECHICLSMNDVKVGKCEGFNFRDLGNKSP